MAGAPRRAVCTTRALDLGEERAISIGQPRFARYKAAAVLTRSASSQATCMLGAPSPPSTRKKNFPEVPATVATLTGGGDERVRSISLGPRR